MQMLKKIFNSDSKYYLELDEKGESKPVEKAVKAVEQAKEVVQEKTTEVLESKPVEQAKEVVQEKLQSATKTETKPKAESKAKSSKKQNKKGKAEQPQQTAKVSTKSAGASSFEPPFWVAAMYNNGSAGVNSDGTQAEQTFATDNLMPTVTKYRRRPGPSLSKFRDMAKTAKTPRG